MRQNGLTLAPVVFLLAMIRAGEVSRVSALLFLVPPLAALLGWAILGEIMPPRRMAGHGAGRVGSVHGNPEVTPDRNPG